MFENSKDWLVKVRSCRTPYRMTQETPGLAYSELTHFRIKADVAGLLPTILLLIMDRREVNNAMSSSHNPKRGKCQRQILDKQRLLADKEQNEI